MPEPMIAILRRPDRLPLLEIAMFIGPPAWLPARLPMRRSPKGTGERVVSFREGRAAVRFKGSRRPSSAYGHLLPVKNGEKSVVTCAGPNIETLMFGEITNEIKLLPVLYGEKVPAGG